jgi:hypothetical protein
MANDYLHGIDLWASVTKTLNDIILEEREISIDDRRIWNGYLHRWTNEDWEAILTAVYQLYQEHPEFFKPFHKEGIEAAILTLLNNEHQSHRVLDQKAHKKTAWKLIMSLREIWNSANDIFLPNQPSMKSIKPKPATTFNTLFDLEAYAGAQ